MSFTRTLTGFLLLALSGVAGCGDSEKACGVFVEDAKKRLDELAPDDALVAVNGRAFTKADLEVCESVYGKLFQFQKTGIVAPAELDEALRRVKDRRQRQQGDFVRRTLFLEHGRTLGLTIAEPEITAQGDEIVRKLNPKAKYDYARFASRLEKAERDFLRWMIESDLMAEAVRKRHAQTQEWTVTEKEIDEGEARLVRHDAEVAETNAVLRARLEAALAEVRAGKDFAATARKYSQFEPEQGECWDTFEDNEIKDDNPQLLAWLKTAKPGDISDILELDESLSIVKLLEKKQAEASLTVRIPTEYRLARIATFVFDKAPKMTRDEIKSELVKWKRSEAHKQLADILFHAARIDYPSGTNLFDKAKQPAADTVPATGGNDT